MKEDEEKALKELQQIPGVGKAVAKDLWNLGYTSISALKGQDPEIMYVLHNRQKGAVQDICMLYTFRGAVYYAETPTNERDPQKMKWWAWMDPEKMTSIAKDAQIRKTKNL